MIARVLGKLREDDGAVAVTVAVSLTMLVAFAAFAVDTGAAYVAHRQLQVACDAGALAGVREIAAGNSGSSAAAKIFAANDAPAGASPSVSAGGDFVVVDATADVPTFFAKAIGVAAIPVSAHAKAVLTTPTELTSVMPFGVPKEEFAAAGLGGTVTLKEGSGGGTSGNYHLLCLDGKGSSDLVALIGGGGSSSPPAVGAGVTTDPGVKSAPIKAFKDTIECSHTYKDAVDEDGFARDLKDGEERCHRLVVVPIVDGYPDVKGTSSVTIVGYAQFFVTEFAASGGTGSIDIVGKFVKAVSIKPGSGGAPTPYGIYQFALVE